MSKSISEVDVPETGIQRHLATFPILSEDNDILIDNS